MRYLVALFTLTILFARENPFIPGEINNSDLYSTNITTNATSKFTTQNINFPSDARELEKIVFYYKDVQGEIKKKVVDINASFDWKDNFILKTQENPERIATPKLDVSVTTNTTQAIETQQIKKLSSKQKSAIKSFGFQNRIRFDIFDDKIVFFTSDKKIQDYLTIDKSKIVLDFAKTEGDFKTKSIKADAAYLKQIVFGSHGKHYRAVLWIDKIQNYKINQISNDGYEISFN